MMAFVHHQMSVVAYQILHHVLADDALDQCHVDVTGEFFSAAAPAADFLWRDPEKL